MKFLTKNRFGPGSLRQLGMKCTLGWDIPGDVPSRRRSLRSRAPEKKRANSILPSLPLPPPGPIRTATFGGGALLITLLLFFGFHSYETADSLQLAESGYRASIEKQANVLTITLRDPEKQKPVATTAVSSNSKTTAPTSQSAPVETKHEPRLVTHQVVKGDTLWDITEKYVKNPYLYPELARLSNIDNPDLIYPGDIVRIVFQ